MKTKIRIGIDIGKKGAIAIFTESNLEVFEMPTILTKEYDIALLAETFIEFTDTEKYDVHVVMEDVHAIFGVGAGATFDFGRGLGLLEGILSAYQIPYTKVMPKKWQEVCFEGIQEIRKPASEKQRAAGRIGGRDTKAMALLAVKRLFPKLKLTFGPRAKKPHDGLIDATLLGFYCKNNF